MSEFAIDIEAMLCRPAGALLEPVSQEQPCSSSSVVVSTTTSTSSSLPTYRHFLAAGTASAVASGTFHPLDCLRVRWQLASTTSHSSILEFGTHILQREGLISGLWKPGIGAHMVGMATSSSLRFGYYETIRNLLGGGSTEKKKQHWHMVVAGLACGASAYWVTTPFHLIKTRMQAQAGSTAFPKQTNFVRAMIQLVAQTGHWSSLYKGWLPLSLRGALFTAGQMVGYDGVKTVAKDYYGYEDGPFLHAISSISSAFCASFLSAPADYVMARHMTTTTGSLLQCIQTIYTTEGGVLAFWKGWSVFFVRLAPVLFVYTSVYEQLRYQFGLGYLN